MGPSTPELLVCHGELNWTVAYEETGIAYIARCPRCGTLHSSGTLPPAVDETWHCTCLLPRSR